MHNSGESSGYIGDYDWNWQIEISETEKLPILSEYKYIKDFQDYELTQCIVYELAIRNPRYKEEVDYIMEFYKKHKKDIDFSIENRDKPIERKKGQHITHSRFIELKRLVNNIEVIPINFEENILEYKDIKAFDKDFYRLLDYILKNERERRSNRKKKPLIDETHTVKKTGFKLITKVNSLQQPALYLPTNTKDRNTQIKKRKKYSPYTPQNQKEYFSIISKYNNNKNSNNVEERLSSRDLIQSSIKIKESFKRPKIKLNNGVSKDIKVEINLSRPKSEIIAYITYLKDYIKDNDEQIKNPISLLDSLIFGTEYHLGKKETVTKKLDTFAQMLFVYDYIETRKRNNETYNTLLRNNRDEKIKIIKESHNQEYNKTKSIDEACKYYLEKKAPVSYVLLESDKMSIQDTKQTSGTIKNYCDDIKSYLKDERYKKLLSENRL